MKHNEKNIPVVYNTERRKCTKIKENKIHRECRFKCRKLTLNVEKLVVVSDNESMVSMVEN